MLRYITKIRTPFTSRFVSTLKINDYTETIVERSDYP